MQIPYKGVKNATGSRASIEGTNWEDGDADHAG